MLVPGLRVTGTNKVLFLDVIICYSIIIPLSMENFKLFRYFTVLSLVLVASALYGPKSDVVVVNDDKAFSSEVLKYSGTCCNILLNVIRIINEF